jgi:hypothetical protein
MSTKETLLSSITETETQLERLKEQLLKQKEELTKLTYPASIQEAEIGDVFKDGTILFAKAKFDKYTGIAFFVGPKGAQFSSEYHSITRKIAALNYTTRWFVPSYKLIKRAIENVPEQFDSGDYWTSSPELNNLTQMVINLKIEKLADYVKTTVTQHMMSANTSAKVRLFTTTIFDI